MGAMVAGFSTEGAIVPGGAELMFAAGALVEKTSLPAHRQGFQVVVVAT